MHPIRRRKKRPNYGVRTVEVSRGKNGFGFTISGQHPCILSCIVAGSPAECAGLRAGDYLVAVDGHSVSKVPHDDVVRLIGCSSRVLKLQIAENYYSDSSDDDVMPVRPKPKYLHKPRSSTHQTPRSATHQDRVAKVVRDLRTGAMFEESLVQPSACVLTEWNASPTAPTPPPRPYHHLSSENEGDQLQFVVGYLGTIEIPKQLQPGSKLQIVCACVRKLRAEKRTPSAVLMTVLSGSIRLTDCRGALLANYPNGRVLFCSSTSDTDRRYFGLITCAPGPEDESSVPSSACHVFAIDAKMTSHNDHLNRAETFKLECGASCSNFPKTSDPIVRAIQQLYVSEEPDPPLIPIPEHDGGSPQPSSANSSNSDSGIGFRDDCGNQSDRILVVDVEHQRLHIHQVGESNLALSLPPLNSQRLTVRAMPDPQDLLAREKPKSMYPSYLYSRACQSQDDLTASVKPCCSFVSVEDMSMMSTKTDSVKFHELTHFADSNDDLMSYKLSPKVFGLPRPAMHSMEDLTVSDPGRGPHWGSLQDLRSLVANCFEVPLPPGSAPLALPEHEDPSVPEDADEAEGETHQETGGVAAWSSAFERLLCDPAGLHTFAEFLKKEFSHENIYFWVACERYRYMTDSAERETEARIIFDKHLCLGAPEPVNVDSHARQVTQEQLEDASQDLFLQAQKQIFNLMKFDSYPRFIKSELYKECLLREISGQQLPFNGSTEFDQGLKLDRPSKLKKSRSDAEDRRRKSLLPWHRKNRSKSKDRGESEYSKLQTRREQYDTVSIRSDVTSSRSSLASWDLALRGSLSRQSVTSGDTSERDVCALCRVILPDGATTVVQTKHNETVSDLIQRLLEKRGLSYQHFQVFVGSNPKAVSLDEVSTLLSNKEVRVEPRVVFRLDLPNRKTVGVKSRPGKMLGEVLRPVLHKYGYRLHLVTVCLMAENEVVSLGVPVSAVDNQRLQVLTRSSSESTATPLAKFITSTTNSSTVSNPGLNASVALPVTATTATCPAPTAIPVPSASIPSASLDEITNRVFEELLQGKATPSHRPTSDQGSVRSEEWGSEHSSGIFGRLLRRDSTHDKSKDFRLKGSKKYMGSLVASKNLNSSIASGTTKPAPPPPSSKPPLIAKWKPGAKLLGQSESDELYEGLKRAQRSRLEDQRGTEINFELPDFLKDKENAPQSTKKIRKFLQSRREGANSTASDTNIISGSRESLLATPLSHKHAQFCLDSLLGVGSGGSSSNIEDESTPKILSHGLNSVPSPRQAFDFFSGCSQPACVSLPPNLPTSLPSLNRLSDPPPLPPKPKYLRAPAPPRIPGGEITNRQDSLPNPSQSRNEVRQAVFLDQSTSSFV